MSQVKTMEAIITGGTGFIGQWLIKELIDNGYKVNALVRHIPLKQVNQLVKYIEYYSTEYYDFINNCSLNASIRNFVFFHLAWGGVSSEEKNNTDLQIENIRFALEMLELSTKIGVSKFIAIGTVAEYMFSESVMNFDAKQTPNDMYGAAKTATHYLMETRARQINMPFIWAVLPSTFGEGRKDNNILTYTIKTLLKREKPQYGCLTQMWDFLYVAEVVRALRLIAEKGIAGKTYGIGSGVYKPLKDYVITIRNLINPALPLGIGENPSLSQKAFSSCVNISELTNDTGFKPEISFEEGIIKTINYCRNNI